MSEAPLPVTPFATGWLSFGLDRCRPGELPDTFYQRYAYERLPSLPPLDGSLHWLTPMQDPDWMEVVWSIGDENGPQLATAAREQGLILPDSFVRFMITDKALQERVPRSSTDLYWQLSDEIVPCPGSEEGRILHFLTTETDYMSWFLYLTPGGEECVLASPYKLHYYEPQKAPEQAYQEIISAAEYNEANEEAMAFASTAQEMTPEQIRRALITATRVCAPSFEAFLYRLWRENTLTEKLGDSSGEYPLTEDEQRYLAHYQEQSTEDGK
jgi:hypothetical protein